MNTMLEIWNGPAAQQLGWVLVHFIWQAALISLLYRLAAGCLRRQSANARYLAGCIALGLVATVPAATWLWLDSAQDTKAAPTVQQTAPAKLELTTPRFSPTPAVQAETIVASRSQAGWFADTLGTSGSGHHQMVQRVLPWLVLGWLAGVHCLGVRLLLGWLAVQRLRRTGLTDLPDEILNRAQRLARRLALDRSVRFVQSALVEIPTVIGWLKPVILMPAGCLLNLTPAQLEAILAHELAHVRRHDYLVNLLQSTLETLFFYHPAVWWLSGAVRQERENCCDDLAVALCGNRFAYARALVSLEEQRGLPGRLAVAAQGGDLHARIVRLLGGPDLVRRGTVARSAAAAVLAVGLALAVVLQLASIAADAPPVEKAAAGKTGEAGQAGAPGNAAGAKALPEERLQFEARLSEGSLEIVESAGRQVAVEAYRLVEGRRVRDERIEQEVSLVQKENHIEAFAPRGLGRNVVFRFHVPGQCDLDLSSSHGDVAVGNYSGSVEASVSAGQLQVGKLGGNADLRASGGHILVAAVGGKLKARSSGGSLKAGELKGPADLFASGGNISVKSAAAKLEARTSGGTVKIFRALAAVEATASGGSVLVNLAGQPDAQTYLKSDGGTILAQVNPKLNLAVQADGETKGDLPLVWEAKDNPRNRKGKLNDGGAALKLRAEKIQLDALPEGDQFALGKEQWSDRMESGEPARAAEAKAAPEVAREGDRNGRRGRTITVWVEDFKDGMLTVIRRADGGDRVMSMKITDATEIWREIEAWEDGFEGKDRQRKQVKATANALDKGAKILLTQVAESEAAAIVIPFEQKAIARREGDAPRGEAERADVPRAEREAAPRLLGGGVSTSVRTVNGQTVVTMNGKEVWSGPTRGNVSSRARNINGENLVAAFEGDRVLWENVPGAADRIKGRNPAVRREGDAPREGDRPWQREAEPPVQPAPAQPVKLMAKGIFMRDGTFVAADVLSADDTQVKYRQTDGKEATALLARVAVLLLKPYPEDKQEALERDRRGLLLVNGDFFESELKELSGSTVTVNSVLFGQRQYDITKQVQAVIVRGTKPADNAVPNVLKGFEPVGIKPPTEGQK